MPVIIKENEEAIILKDGRSYRQSRSRITSLADVSIVSERVQRRPEGVSFSATQPSETDSQPTRTMKESMESLPGVVLRQANGPRDFSIMIRGQGAKTAFAVRDIKIYEDGFIQTQSDGLSRLDIQDPWFMRSVEVTRGASSSLYDNYALGGMVQFRTRRGSDINGVETFLSGGSYGYHKEALAFGQQTEHLDLSMFISNVGEDGFIQNSNYKTQTLNFNLRLRSTTNRTSISRRSRTGWMHASPLGSPKDNSIPTSDRLAGRRQPAGRELQRRLRQCCRACSKAKRPTHHRRRHVRAANQCQYRVDHGRLTTM